MPTRAEIGRIAFAEESPFHPDGKILPIFAIWSLLSFWGSDAIARLLHSNRGDFSNA